MPLYSATYAFGSKEPYRKNAWIQDQYNASFITTHILPAVETLLLKTSQEELIIHDILCGDGFSSLKIFELLSRRAESMGKRLLYIGIDISAEQIKKAEELAQQSDVIKTLKKSKLSFVHSAIENFQPTEEKADILLCLFGLHLLEENLQQKLEGITKNLAKDGGELIAIYPLRVAILYRARQQLLTQAPWKELLGDNIVRYISDSEEPYKNAIKHSTTLTAAKFDTLDKTHHISREQFETFFKSWAPEFRGIFPEDKHRAYLDAIWNTLISFKTEHQEEGFVSPDEHYVTFNDKIRALRADITLKPAPLPGIQAKL